MTLIEAISIACIDALGRAPVWGEDDCCTFACDAVKAAHGIDLMEPLRGKYSDAETAAAAMWRYASGGLGETAVKLSRRAALTPVAFPFGGAEIGVISSIIGPQLAVSDGTAWVARIGGGVTRVPLWRAVLAWRVS